MSLKTSYRFIAPFYDFFLRRASAATRKRSLARIANDSSLKILVNGVGTGLDFPFLPPHHHYTSLDLTREMLARSLKQVANLDMAHAQGDSMRLPFADESFDVVVLHLILAVVPQPERCLAETTRVLKHGGRILVFDKFLQPGQHAWVRRTLNIFISRIATRLDVVFEDVLATTPELRLISDKPALANGWFRLIELQKQ
ncbi:MAG: class I SAM-dependent methyltransferase [Gallionellaceae bacterium]|nr:class I SAM-dependent methyltransferase [Gallionellaceae bacterium]